MKTKFSDIQQCIHVFAQRRQSNGECGNVFFEGNALYSYGRHFPLAAFVVNDGNAPVVLLNNDNYSISTTRHQSYARSALAQYVRLSLPTEAIKAAIEYGLDTARLKRDERGRDDMALYCRKRRASFLGKICHMAEQAITSGAQRAEKRRMKAKKADDIAEAKNDVAALSELLSLYGLKLGAPYLRMLEALENDYSAVLAAKARKDKAEAKERAKREAERLRRIEEQAAEAKAAFLAGAVIGHTYRHHLSESREILLRQYPGDSTLIETSHGAKFPIKHGMKALEIIRACVTQKKEWQRNGKTIHLGEFQIDRITPEGDVKAGCHLVPYAEIERIAAILKI